MDARRPTKADLEAAKDRLVPDVIAPGLKVLFVGINPGLYTAAVGHHFGRPGNRFWPALHLGGVTPRVFRPSEQHLLPGLGYGVSNVVPRASAAADELSKGELIAGGKALEEKVARFRPRVVAFLGVGAYRTAFGRPKAKLGLQEERMEESRIWVLPNPSGLNAHFSVGRLGELIAELREWVDGAWQGRMGRNASDLGRF
jgi:double-stranded uracil-DNA glycosylase